MRRAILCCALLSGCPSPKARGWLEPPKDGTEVVDPVSGERCLKSPMTEAAVYLDRTHYFCGATRGAFAADPGRYAQ